jgi:tetratricopeptide (TPR) repeat protein
LSLSNWRNHTPEASPRWAWLLVVFCLVFGGQWKSATAQQSTDLQSASSLLLEKRYADAIALLTKIMPAHEQEPEAHVMLAYALFRNDRPTESLKEYTRAAQLRTPSAADLKWVALDYVLLNDYKDASKWMSVSLSMDQNDEEAWYGMGRIDYMLNNFRQAQSCFEQALKLHPLDVNAENNLGLTYEALYRLDDAIAAYRTAIEWQQDSPHPSEQPYLNLATVLLNQNKFDQALPLLQKAISIAPDDAKVLAQLARVDLQQNQLSAAEQDLRHALQSKPNDASLHFQLARVLQKENKLEEAKAEFAKTSALDSTHSSPDR